MWRTLGVLVGALMLLLQAPTAKAQWTEAPCFEAALAAGDGLSDLKCWAGPDFSSGQCVAKRSRMEGRYQGGPSSAWAIRPIDPSCWAASMNEERALKEMQTYTQLTKNGTDWSAMRTVGNAFVAEFVSNKRRCVGFVNFGPAQGNGYRWRHHGYSCAAAADRAPDKAFTDDEIKARMALFQDRR